MKVHAERNPPCRVRRDVSECDQHRSSPAAGACGSRCRVYIRSIGVVFLGFFVVIFFLLFAFASRMNNWYRSKRQAVWCRTKKVQYETLVG